MTEIKIQNERDSLSGSLWSATANGAPERPALEGETEADCVIIGAGFNGLSAALHLAEAGRSVVVLEANTPGWGASGRNGGQVNPGLKANPVDTEAKYGQDLGRRMVERAAAGGKLVFDLITKHNIECDANPCGWIRSATNARSIKFLADVAAQWRERGHDVRDVSRDEMAHLLGASNYVGGIIDRRGGNLHPLNYALGLAAAAERNGARIHGNSKAVDIKSNDDHVAVSTKGGMVKAKKALICTNAYTGDLLNPLGQTIVPVTSVQVATEPLSDNVARSILPEGHSPTDTHRLLLYFRKDRDGRFIMGGRGAMNDSGIRRRQSALRVKAEELYPQLKGFQWRYAWGGNVAMTRNQEPGLHLLAPNVMAGIGFNGRGVGMATVMGTILADWADGMPVRQLDFPVSEAKPIPFHRFRQIGLGATVATFKALDRLGL